jgi:hypothetical protein
MSARAVGATSLTQQSENFGYSAVRLRRIVKIQFGIINPTDLVCYADGSVSMLQLLSFLIFFLLYFSQTPIYS